MLQLSERVSKRARMDTGTGVASRSAAAAGGSGCDPIADDPPDPRGPLRPQPKLQLNLGPAAALAYTQTRVPLSGPLCLTDFSEPAPLGSVAAASVAPRLDLSSRPLLAGGDRGSNVRPVVLRSDRAAPAEFSWDCLGEQVSKPLPSPSWPYGGDVKPTTKTRVLRAAAGAAVGFESKLVFWDEHRTQLRVVRSIRETEFGKYLETFARCGSYVRRLGAAAKSIRRMTSGHTDSRTALALAAAIESEVGVLVSLLDPEAYGFVALYSQCFRTNSLAASLAELIGCADMKTGGRLLKLPSAVTLLDRVYTRACLQQSQRWHSHMLWVLVCATTAPWLDQLSFVVGITEPLVVRESSCGMKQAYFPELFLDVKDENTVDLVDSNVPSFVAPDLARAAVQCYNMLIILGMKGYDALHAGITELPPLSLENQQPIVPGAPSFLSRLSRQPENVQAGVQAIFDTMQPGAAAAASAPSSVESAARRAPLSVESEFWRALAPVSMRQIELNLVVRQALQHELLHLRALVVDLYLLGNGKFWSIFQDMVGAMYNDWGHAAAYIPAMNELASEVCDGAFFTFHTARPRSLRLMCPLPATITTVFPPSYFNHWQSLFSALVRLHCDRQHSAFGQLAADCMIAINEINRVVGDDRCGMGEVTDAFGRVPSPPHARTEEEASSTYSGK